MLHYLSILKETIRRNWVNNAISNYGGATFTFRDVAVQIEKIHTFFRNIGVCKGDNVALCASNSAQWGISFLSILSGDTVAVPILSDFLPENVCSLVDRSRSKVLFTDSDLWAKLDISKMPSLSAVIIINDFSLAWSADDSIKKAFDGIEETMEAGYPDGFTADDIDYPTDNENDLAVINYTSGTTSSPKGVMILHRSFSQMVEFASKEMPCCNSDSIVSMLPMGHIYGLVFEFIFPICCGAHVYFLGKAPAASTLLQAMAEIKPFLVITVPLVMEKIYKKSIKPVIRKPFVWVLTHIPVIDFFVFSIIRHKLLKAFGGNVREFILGGAAMNPEVENVLYKMRFPYTMGYGMTEAAPVMTYSHSKDYIKGSCGKVLYFTDLKIDSPDPAHKPGEILAKGVNMFVGYYDNPEATQAAFTEDGYFKTGDLGIITKRKVVYLKGRLKTMILSANGQNIYPEELETIINSQPYVVESIVVSRKQGLVALVYPDNSAIRRGRLSDEEIAQLPKTIMNACNARFPQYSRLAKVELVDNSFEKTPKLSIKRFLYE